MSSKSSKYELEKPVKVNKWDGNAVKIALDDMIRHILIKKYNYVESCSLIDGRLLICGFAVAVASFALLWDRLYPFPQSKNVVLVCVTSYFILMGILSLYATYKEKSIFAVAIQKDHAGYFPERIWQASSNLKKYDDKYRLELSVQEGDGPVRTATLSRSVANFFDEKGQFLLDLLEPEINKLHNSLLNEKKEK